MIRTVLVSLLLAAAILSILSAPESARGDDLIVEHNPAPGNFATIQAAINQAQALIQQPANVNKSYRVLVKADPNLPYTGPITPINNVNIIGESTAKTTISGAGTLMTMNGVSSVQIRNFTFFNAAVAISVSGNSSNIDIRNNVFNLPGGVGVQVAGSPSTSIINNTFYNNATAISTTSDILITNDIFANNGVAIGSQANLTQLLYDDFFLNGSNGVANLGSHSIPSSLVPNANPLFVDPASRDFHLQAGSPAHTIPGTPPSPAGNPNYPNSFDSATFDMGAYGGPYSDLLLVPVQGLTSSLTTPSTITLTWSASSNSAVTGYNVYYGTASGNYHGTEAAAGPSPFFVSGRSSNTATLSGLPTTVPQAPTVPANVTVTPLNNSLQVSWTPVSGASGYQVYFSTTQFDASSLPASFVSVGAGEHPSAQITGLTNGTRYFVAVRALAQQAFFAAVTAVIDGTTAPNFGAVNANESGFSNETSQTVSQQSVGELSPLVAGTPEVTAPYPNVKGEGCFIATAAFGFYSAPQVQVLRDFRDRYLLTNTPGRAFVAWYYRYGPIGAHFINVHPWLKPPVRLALLPLVVGATILLHVSLPMKIALLVVVAAFALLIWKVQRRLVHAGGMS